MQVLSLHLKLSTVFVVLMPMGRAFHSLGAAINKSARVFLDSLLGKVSEIKSILVTWFV